MATTYPQISYLQTSLISKSSCNQRLNLDESQVFKMIHTLLSGQPLPAIFVRVEGNQYGCYDGIHRLEAYKRCNIPLIPAIIMNVSDIDAIINSYRSNCGKGWTEGEKVNVCLKLCRVLDLSPKPLSKWKDC